MLNYAWKLYKDGQPTDSPLIHSETRVRELLGQFRGFATELDHQIVSETTTPNEMGFVKLDPKTGTKTELLFRKYFQVPTHKPVAAAARPVKKK